jgi:3-oxoacyl-[acyl-carrier protein] reductase/(S)-1-phenylethanol dehydrogenase
VETAGRVALVTGGAAGAGRGIARRLAAEGAEVVVADLEEPGEGRFIRTERDR